MTTYKNAKAAIRNSRAATFVPCLLLAAMIFAPAGRAYGAGDAAVYIDEKGSVGVGTQKPGSPLSVSGGVAIGDQGFVETKPAPASGLVVQGRVGIGNPAPGVPLDVTGNAVIDGQLRIGGTADPASTRPLDVAAPGGIGIRQTANQSEQNEIFFQDNGQIRSLDNTHRIIFNRSVNQLELREAGDILLSAGATGGQRTSTVVVNSSGMAVNGTLSAAVRYQRDDDAEGVYQKPLQRYHLSLTAKAYGGRTKTIPKDTLLALCGTPDGCEVRLGMTRWDNDNETETASRSVYFYYSPDNGRWRTSDDKTGVAGNGATEHAINIWGTCFFTDGTYAGYQDQGDKATGMQLLVWRDFGGPNRTCELTLVP